jgi:hypothetical protein
VADAAGHQLIDCFSDPARSARAGRAGSGYDAKHRRRTGDGSVAVALVVQRQLNANPTGTVLVRERVPVDPEGSDLPPG